MKRALILLLALAISVLAAGQARAANAVSAKAVAKSPSEVAAYWTAERMRKAKPVARVKGNGN